ncbi:hypothetical protein Q8791_23050 [Nocardiopsis sp. CT-R113]|uniref:Uncharacterized protein n=1 Tax=Nocardiopsis codii TaxID=3065942 RepID=A0ABU7KCY7_9ACTN|nr:hypothetical protein [Nocardiopsis sp. CT-R113]MEE2040099.1 hypothetical protein [Nocardiopsis sp. CT-R113]
MTPEQLTRQYIADCYKEERSYENHRVQLLTNWETKGHTIVSGHYNGSNDSWNITDYRNGKLLAEGTGHDEYNAVWDSRGAQWVDYDHATRPLDDHLTYPERPEGLPDSLCDALAQWVDNNPEDAAAFLLDL